jgi:hypothetical protein
MVEHPSPAGAVTAHSPVLAFADSKKCRVAVLSGDVHVGALGMIESTRGTAEEPSSQVINQLTSSGIVHPPPCVVLFSWKL